MPLWEDQWESGTVSDYAGRRYPLRGNRSKKDVDDTKATAAGDAPKKKKDKDKDKEKGKHDPKKEVKIKGTPSAPLEVQLMNPSFMGRADTEVRAQARRRTLCKKAWPEVTKVKINTKPWTPPGPPERMPRVIINYPRLNTEHKWVPPFAIEREKRPPLPRMRPDMVEPITYELSKFAIKVWHNFQQVDTNKMMIRGKLACNSRRYQLHLAGAQTGCIALACRALLDEKSPAELVWRDIDDCIRAGDTFYKQCMMSMLCYKGKPALPLRQLKSSFFFHGSKYTVDMTETDRGVLAKSPDNVQAGDDLMALMERRAGSEYMGILTVGDDTHFLIWGHPPTDGGNVRTVCYIFDPHMFDQYGLKSNVAGAGVFLRYPGVTSFVLDFVANYGNLKTASKAHPKPPITITAVEITSKSPIPPPPGYSLDLCMIKTHCKSEWEALNIQALYDEKRNEHKWVLASLSQETIKTSRKSSRKKVDSFYQKGPKEPPPAAPPVMPEKPPPPPTTEQLMQNRGEDFFLYCPKQDAHTFGRDDMVPYAKTSEQQLFSPVEIADQNFRSQYDRLGGDRTILRGTRHFASYRYQTFKWFHGIACCVVALGMLRRYRGRAWNEDTVDETLDTGWNFFRESLMERRGPIRRLVLGELKKTFKIRDVDYKHKERGVAVWGKIVSRKDPKIFDLCRGLDHFFKEADSGILQIPGEFETAIWYEGKKYYMYHPWPADKYGNRVSLQGGGKACVLTFASLDAMCEHFMDNVAPWKRKPFSISDVRVYELGLRPEPVNDLKPIGSSRWGVRGLMNEADESFPEANRGKQATPASICAIAMAHMVDPATWTAADIDEILKRGDVLYEKTMEHLDKLGINFETPTKEEENEAAGEEEEMQSGTTGTLAAADVLPRFRISEFDCIETDIQDSLYSGQLNPEPGSGVMSLKDSLAEMFKKHTAAVVTARGGSMAIFKHDNHLYFFDPHGCDENGMPSDEPRAAAVLVRMKDNVKELADVIMGNLAPGNDDSFNISPVEIISSKLNPELGAPEIKQDSKQHEWIQKNTATILMGPRGQNSALGKAATKCSVGHEDLAGRKLGLPAAVAFCAAADLVPPPGMHQDHMFNFLDAGADYYVEHCKKTGRKDITVEDFTDPIVMGANTFTVEIGEPTRLPLRLPDSPAEGGEEAGEGGGGLGEGEEPKEVLKEMKELLFKIWYDTTKPTSIHLMLGDYHQLGVWMSCEGQVVVFDPAPTLAKGLLTPQRMATGDALRMQRIKGEMAGEGEEDAAADEAGGEEATPEPEPESVPPESCPVLMTFSSPAEFIDKLVLKAPLDGKQMMAPYWLFPVTVTNELTSVLKEKKPGVRGEEEEGEEVEEALVEPLDEEAIGPHFKRCGRTVASVRGEIRQDEQYFLENPNRDNQDSANVVMGIVVEHIEPCVYWKPHLIDAILKYGDRLYTLSVPNARNPPKLAPDEVAKEFQVTHFNVTTNVTPDVVTGDLKAPDSGKLLNLARGIKRFFETEKHGVICCKGYCVGIWKSQGDKAYVYWDPHGVGPIGKSGPESSAGLVLFSTAEELGATLKHNIDALDRALPNKYTIASVKVTWEFTKVPPAVSPPGAVPDEGYEWKVLTAYVEFARGRTILRGSRPAELSIFCRDAVLSSSASAVVAACMTLIRRPHLWTRKTVDEIMSIGCSLFNKSIGNLGYEFRPGEDILLPLQVLKRFQMGVNYVRYNLEAAYQGKMEMKGHSGTNLRACLGNFFESHTHGILWCSPHAVAVWRVVGAPTYYMCEPHCCSPLGLRDAQDDVAPAVMQFTSPKLMAFQYLQNYPVEKRPDTEFTLYVMSVTVAPIPRFTKIPPLVKPQPGRDAVSATAKCAYDGKIRRADEGDRRHPPGSVTCMDIVHATDLCDRLDPRLKGVRNANGWLVVTDGSQYMSAQHSITCKKFPYASRGNQALACAIMAVAMSRIQDVCHWCETTLDRILDSGDQLYQDSYLHYRPKGPNKLLNIEQILRKFYTPGNCVCKVGVFEPRQEGSVTSDPTEQLKQFFREESMGVFDVGDGKHAVALFKTLKGFYMFDPGDRDRYGRAVAPPCVGRGRACLSQYPKVKMLADKLSMNVVDITTESEGAAATAAGGQLSQRGSKVHFSKPANYKIYGMVVSTLRKLNQ